MKTKELLKIAVNSRFCRVLASVSGHILLAADRRRTYMFPGIPYLYDVFSVWYPICIERTERISCPEIRPIHTMMHPYVYLSIP